MDQKDRELTEALNELNLLTEDFLALSRDFHTLQEAVKDLLQANGIPPDAWGNNAKEPRWKLVQHSRLSKKIYKLLKG